MLKTIGHNFKKVNKKVGSVKGFQTTKHYADYEKTQIQDKDHF